MKKIYFLEVLFAGALTVVYYSIAQDAQIFALGEVFKKKFPPHTHHLNPFHGLVSAKTDFIANIVRYNPSSKTAHLLAPTIFYLHEEDSQLRVTTHKPVGLFNACSIAQLVYSLSEKDDLNANDMQEVAKTYRGKKYQSRLEEFRNNITTLFKENKKYCWYGLLTFLYLHTEDPYSAAVQYCESLARHYTIEFGKKEFLQEIEKQPCSPSQELMQTLLEYRTGYGLPSPIRYSIKPIAYKNYPPVQDCCESALREVVSVYYYLNGNSSQGPAAALAALDPSIQNYFKTHPVINNEDLLARKDWFALLCEKGFEYKQKSYGVLSRITNFKYGLEYLLKSDNAATIDKNNFWESWALAISTSSIIWKVHKQKIQAEDRADISWNIINNENKRSYRITLHIRPRHAWVTRDCFDLLPAELHLSSQPSDAMTELLLYTPWLSDAYLIRNPDLIYSLPSSNDSERYQLVQKALDLFNFFKQYKKISLTPLIEKIMPTIEDPDYLRKGLKKCMMNPKIWSLISPACIEEQKKRLNEENLIAFHQDLRRFDPQGAMQKK